MEGGGIGGGRVRVEVGEGDRLLTLSSHTVVCSVHTAAQICSFTADSFLPSFLLACHALAFCCCDDVTPH